MNMDPIKEFEDKRRDSIKKLGEDKELKELALKFFTRSFLDGYVYNFNWLGRPIIQYPQDIMALQEVIWDVQPDLIVETGIAHGGSLILSASILELIGGDGEAVGIDIEIRKHNREAIEKHRMFKRIKLIEGSSVDPVVVAQVKKLAEGKKKVLVYLDSNHSHDHVLKELEAYAPLVSVGSYCIVFDTLIEYIPEETITPNPTWGKGNNAKTAVDAFLKTNGNFVIDRDRENKIVITFAPGGFLKRVK